jgi:hypothetical protein
MTEVYRYDDIDYTKLNFEKPQKQNNYYYSNISYSSNKDPFFLQTSKLKINSDIKVINMKQPSIEFEISNDNFDMYDLFMKLDDKLVKTTYNNSKEWFNQNIPLENIEDMYKCICKPLKKNKNPNLKFKFAIENQNVYTKIFDQNRNIVKLQDCKRGYDTVCILHIRGIKFMKQQYICDIYINQMKINIPNKVDYIIPDKCIIGDFEKSYDSDEDIIDNEVINIKKNERKILLENKKKELENLEKLKEEIDRLEKDN